MKRTISKFIALTVTAIMALSVAVPTLPSSFASTTEEGIVIEATTENSTEEAITTEAATTENAIEEFSTEVSTEVTTEFTEDKLDGVSTESTTEVLVDVTTENSSTPSEEMLYELLFDEEWVTELTEDEIKEMYGFDSREEFEQYVEMIVGSGESSNEEASNIATNTDAEKESLIGQMNGMATNFALNRAGDLIVADLYKGKYNGSEGSMYVLSNGVQAFCIEHDKDTAYQGTVVEAKSGLTYFGGETTAYKNMVRALYYFSYYHSTVVSEGGGLISTNMGEDNDRTKHDYAVLCFALSYYNGNSTFLGSYPDVATFLNYLNSKPYPLLASEAKNVSLSATSIECDNIVTVNGSKKIKSDAIKLNANNKLVYTFTAPSGVSVEVYNSNNELENTFAAGSKVRIRGGETMYVYADMSLANSTTSLSNITCEQPYTYDLTVYEPTTGKQTVATVAQAATKSLSLNIKWSGTAEVKLKKVSSNAALTNGNSNYSLAGCVYNLYEGNNTTGTPYAVFTTNADGTSNVEEVYVGTFTAVEVKAPAGFKLNTEPVTVSITSADIGTTKEISVTDEPITGSVQVLKVLDNEELAGNDCYDKKATYVLRNAQGTQVGTLTTDAVTGLSNIVSGLPLGNYTVVETVASKGCELDTTVHNVTLTTANSSDPSKVSVQVKSVEPTLNDPVVIEIYKIDEDGNKVSGAASLAGAEFTITYYDTIFYTEDEIPAQHERQWVVTTKYDANLDSYMAYLTDEYLVGGDELYKSELENVYVPLGTITIQETKTPEGYLVDGIFKDENGNEIPNGLYITQIETDDEDIPAVVGGHKFHISNTVKRGDLAFTKVDYETLEPMAGIPFRITSETTGESHIYITNQDGVLSTASSVVAHGKNTNANDSLTPDANGYYSGLTYCGAWFSGSIDGSLEELNENVGALPFDSYKIQELRCEANKDKQLIIDTKIVISENGVVVDDGTYTNVPQPSISTMERDSETGTHISIADDDVTIIDTVNYKYLKAGDTYTLWGVIVNKENGTPMKNTDGSYIIDSKVFTVDSTFEKSEFEKCGSEEMTFNFDGTTFDGYDFVVFEYLFEGDVSDFEIIDANGNINTNGVYISHAEINDINQTGSFPPPTGHTIAIDAENGTHTGTPSEKAILVDTVYYEGLVPGYKYQLRGKLWTKDENGEAIPFLNRGEEVTAEIEFTPTESKGSISLTFTYNASALEGKTLTVYEDMYRAGRKIWTHSDIEDSWQSVSYPSIKTLATDKTNSKQLAPYIETQIIDTITYENLVPGETVVVEGIIMTFDENGNEVEALDKNGNTITVTKEVTITDKNGTIEVPFNINTGDFINKTLVVYERVYTKDTHTLIAKHCEINSKDQAVYITDQPKTGDNTPLMVMFGLAGLSLVGIIFMLISRRKRVR